MEAPLHQFLVPPPLLQDDALLQQTVAARALMMSFAGNKQAPPSPAATAAGREQCPRCASRDTKFCYYNNYNTAQPRHFCRACRRYWTLGGSLRNVPVGGSTRKRPRPARRHRAMTAAVAAMAGAPTTATTTTNAVAGGCPFVASPAATLLQGAGGGAGLLVSSLLLGTASASPLLALGAAPLLEGRLGLCEAAALAAGSGADWATGDLAHQQQLWLPWPAETTIYQ